MSSINETSEILILETLESLLTNVEFVKKDSTITNLMLNVKCLIPGYVK